MVTIAESVTKDENAFQTRAPATGKTRSPIVILRVGGTTSADVDAERSLLESLSVTRRISSARCAGAVPCRQRKTSTDSLNSIRLGTHWTYIGLTSVSPLPWTVPTGAETHLFDCVSRPSYFLCLGADYK